MGRKTHTEIIVRQPPYDGADPFPTCSIPTMLPSCGCGWAATFAPSIGLTASRMRSRSSR